MNTESTAPENGGGIIRLSRNGDLSQMAFRKELISLLNRYNRESVSDTPDFALGYFLELALEAFDYATNKRNEWYGFGKKPTRLQKAEVMAALSEYMPDEEMRLALVDSMIDGGIPHVIVKGSAE